MSSLSSLSTTPLRNELGGFQRAFGKFFDSIVQARQAKADAIVKYHLAGLSDDELAANGYSASQMKALRASVKVRLPYVI